MENSQTQHTIHQLQRLHKRATSIWADKEKYLISMRKSGKEIEQFSKKPSNPEREKLRCKLNQHINKIMNEYTHVLQQINQIHTKAKHQFETLSLKLSIQSPSPQIKNAIILMQEIQRINRKASDFSKQKE